MNKSDEIRYFTIAFANYLKDFTETADLYISFEDFKKSKIGKKYYQKALRDKKLERIINGL